MPRDGKQRIYDTKGNLTHIDGVAVEEKEVQLPSSAYSAPLREKAVDVATPEQESDHRHRPVKFTKKTEGRE